MARANAKRLHIILIDFPTPVSSAWPLRAASALNLNAADAPSRCFTDQRLP
jgi:hypothetical protein